MSFTLLSNLPTPQQIKDEFPLPKFLADKKRYFDREIVDIFTGKSNKFIVIIGPCSADNESAVCEYVNRLSKLRDAFLDKLIIIPRVYTNKPRTMGEGYKGLLHQPDPDKKPNMREGIIAIRKMHLKVIMETEMFTADEMLYPDNLSYLDDLMSYIAVGARSVENQQHRLTSSGCEVPVGMKNPTSGDLSVMLNAIYAAQKSHEFIYRGWEVRTSGNPLTHAILRGAVNPQGKSIPNYHFEDLQILCDLYGEYNIIYPAVIVDANHSNSGKRYKEQIRIVKEVLHSRRHSKEIKDFVKGVMIESYLVEGSQKVGEHIYGKSITDPCLGWDDTIRILYEIAEGL